MGRYWDSDGGRRGKFSLGKQPSTDPGDFFGMKELEPNEITYTAEKGDADMIREKVDELYDKLDVPKSERMYYVKKEDTKDEFHDRIQKYVYRKVNRKEIERYDKVDGFKHDGFYCGEKHKVYIEKVKDSALCYNRLWLGLSILSDLEDEGYCELRAEL